MDTTRLMLMRDSRAAIGAPLGVTGQVDQDEVLVAHHDINLREQYRLPAEDMPWSSLRGAGEYTTASVDVNIRVFEGESLFDKLNDRRPFGY